MAEHPDARRNEVANYCSLYIGGKTVRDNLERFIVKRDIERYEAERGERTHFWDARKDRAWYVNRVKPLVNYLVSSILQEPPVLKGNEYFNALNNDADLKGRSLQAVISSLTLAVLLTGRGYLTVVFTGTENQPLMGVLDGMDVLDWAYSNTDDRLLWVKVYRVENVRSSDGKVSNMYNHIWHIISREDTKCYSYTNTKPIIDNFSEEDKEVSEAFSVDHDFRDVPMFDVVSPPGMFVMNELYDPAVALFNAEVGMRCFLADVAYPTRVFILSEDEIGGMSRLDAVYKPRFAAVRLQAGEDYKLVSGNPDGYVPLQEDIRDSKLALYEVLHALSAQAMVNQPQNARQPTTAKMLDLGPMKATLKSFAVPLKETLERWCKGVARYLDVEAPEVSGMDKFAEEIPPASSFGLGARDKGSSGQEKGENDGRTR
jgi:hypothetical protein